MQKPKPVIVFWFRRDLRLFDNHGLYQAIEAAKSRGFVVLPLFIFDKAILSPLDNDDARISFIHTTLSDMNDNLAPHDTSLLVEYGHVNDVFSEMLSTHDIRAVFTNRDYEPDAIARDNAIKTMLAERHVAWRSFKDQVIFERDEILKKDGTPYTVYTPYKNRWLSTLGVHPQLPTYSVDLSILMKQKKPMPTLAEIGFQPSTIHIKPYDLSSVNSYAENRDFPAQDGTSKLSPHLRFGTVSIREMVAIAFAENEVFLSELIWREFFMQILRHFPRVVNESFRVEYDRIQWRNNEQDFTAWCEGKTGYPMVDAGMRELNQTGYMHNRLRMVVASFLCKHLLIDWRWGEHYFAKKLLDYELSANNGNWQWAAGTGCDAAPYFRIFNPETQFKKFDAQCEYVRQFVPEFDSLEYVQPIVEHKFARERCLSAYKKAKETV